MSCLLLLVGFQQEHKLNSESTELFNLNFQSLEVVSRYRDPQLRVTENLCDLRNVSPNIFHF